MCFINKQDAKQLKQKTAITRTHTHARTHAHAHRHTQTNNKPAQQTNNKRLSPKTKKQKKQGLINKNIKHKITKTKTKYINKQQLHIKLTNKQEANRQQHNTNTNQ